MLAEPWTFTADWVVGIMLVLIIVGVFIWDIQTNDRSWIRRCPQCQAQGRLEHATSWEPSFDTLSEARSITLHCRQCGHEWDRTETRQRHFV
jgi:hypothetical protein